MQSNAVALTIFSSGAGPDPAGIGPIDVSAGPCYELEDPRGYCLDIPGFGARMQLDAPITTHTCKYSLPGFDVDEIFEQTDGKLRARQL